MNDKFNKGIKEIKEIRMTKSEKAFVLNNIIDQTTDHARLGGEVPPDSLYGFEGGSYSPQKGVGTSAIKTPYNIIPAFAWMKSNKFYYIIATLVIVGLMGNGIAIAAENSLPGDTLYPIKVNVVEPAKVALAKTPADRARVEVSIATTRLQEAEMLADQNRLDAQKTDQLGHALDNQAKVVEAAILAVSSSAGTTDTATGTDSINSEIADNIETDFQASMSAHAKILDGIAKEKSSKKTSLASISRSISTSTDEHGALSLARNAKSKSEMKIGRGKNDVETSHHELEKATKEAKILFKEGIKKAESRSANKRDNETDGRDD